MFWGFFPPQWDSQPCSCGSEVLVLSEERLPSTIFWLTFHARRFWCHPFSFVYFLVCFYSAVYCPGKSELRVSFLLCSSGLCQNMPDIPDLYWLDGNAVYLWQRSTGERDWTCLEVMYSVISLKMVVYMVFQSSLFYLWYCSVCITISFVKAGNYHNVNIIFFLLPLYVSTRQADVVRLVWLNILVLKSTMLTLMCQFYNKLQLGVTTQQLDVSVLCLLCRDVHVYRHYHMCFRTLYAICVQICFQWV